MRMRNEYKSSMCMKSRDKEAGQEKYHSLLRTRPFNKTISAGSRNLRLEMLNHTNLQPHDDRDCIYSSKL